MGEADRAKFVRLFLFPGMYHCGGGDGPSEFPLLKALMDWVEEGEAPQVLIAQLMPDRPKGPPPEANGAKPMRDAAPGTMAPDSRIDKAPSRTRPVYAYPMLAHYKGTGSTDSAENFEPITPPATTERYDWLGAK